MINASFLGKKIKSDSSKILLTNNLGSFFFFSPEPFSKYSGLFFREDNEVFKCIEEIKSAGSLLKETDYNLQSFTNKYDNYEETYSFPIGKNSLLYENSVGKEVTLTLDCRKVDDYSNWGRYYEIKKEKDIILIKYSKKKDDKEQSSDEYDIYCAIKADSTEFKIIDKWQEKFYPFDSARNDSSLRHVYNAIIVNSKKIGFGFSVSKSKAIALAYECYKKSIDLGSPENIISNNPKIGDLNLEYAYSLSKKALSSLKVNANVSGVYAGLPWFHQFWTRDTAISAKAYALTEDKTFIKDILIQMLSSAHKDGLIPNRFPHSDLDSIDGSGLVISRLNEVISSLSNNELKQVKDKVKKIFVNFFTFHSKDNLIVSKPYESWMDTDLRSGALIELQALQLSICSTMRKLSNKLKDKRTSDFFMKQERETKKSVLNNFFVNNELLDSLSSSVRRPNVFLAYYFYPELLSDKQWVEVFDKHLASLYLDWGGLSTIDIHNQYFAPNHTGTNNSSYHKGDSWFFINNIVAICLARVDRKKYRKYIEKIISASTEDILNKGIFGFHSEISSASHQEANGCLAQLWSSATYIELLEEIYRK